MKNTKSFEQIVTVELTTSQVVVAAAALNSTQIELGKWLSDHEDADEEVKKSVEKDIESLNSTMRIITTAFKNITDSWSEI